jgi:hypothetical protein
MKINSNYFIIRDERVITDYRWEDVVSTVDPSLTSASTYTPAEEASKVKPEPVNRPSYRAMVDSIEVVVVAQKPSSFQRRARIDTKITSLTPLLFKTYAVLFKALNAMAKITVDAEKERRKEEKRQEFHQLFLKATLEINRRRQAKVRELVMASHERILAVAA